MREQSFSLKISAAAPCMLFPSLREVRDESWAWEGQQPEALELKERDLFWIPIHHITISVAEALSSAAQKYNQDHCFVSFNINRQKQQNKPQDASLLIYLLIHMRINSILDKQVWTLIIMRAGFYQSMTLLPLPLPQKCHSTSLSSLISSVIASSIFFLLPSLARATGCTCRCSVIVMAILIKQRGAN